MVVASYMPEGAPLPARDMLAALVLERMPIRAEAAEVAALAVLVRKAAIPLVAMAASAYRTPTLEPRHTTVAAAVAVE